MKYYYPYPVNDGKHKYYIVTKSEKKVYFGAAGYSDFTKHKDVERRQRYIARHEKNENWICLFCYNTYCSRYINAHALLHNSEQEHCIMFSLTDFSTWCFECDSYIDSYQLRLFNVRMNGLKYGFESNEFYMAEQYSKSEIIPFEGTSLDTAKKVKHNVFNNM